VVHQKSVSQEIKISLNSTFQLFKEESNQQRKSRNNFFKSAIPGLFSLIFGILNQHTILKQINVKN